MVTDYKSVTTDVLNRIAKAMDVNTDFLLNGTLQDKAKNNIKDDDGLLIQFKKVELLSNDKKKLIKEPKKCCNEVF